MVEKFTNEKEQIDSTVFIIDGVVLQGNVPAFKVDENYILKVNRINSNELGYWNGKELFSIVSIFTKSEENIKRFGYQELSQD